MGTRSVAVRLAVYGALAALDLLTTWLAVRSGGVELNPFVRDLVNRGLWLELFALNMLAYTPASLLCLSKSKQLRHAERVFLVCTVALRALTVVNNLLVSLGQPDIVWLLPARLWGNV